MRETPTPQPGSTDRETLELWYDLSRMYSKAASTGGRSGRLGFTVTLVSGALVLLSAPIFGTDWAGPLAALIPVALGLVAGLGMFVRERFVHRRREDGITRALAARGLDARRPGTVGLFAYYDPQLVLIRCEYEYLMELGDRKKARLLADSFGFTPDDAFEISPVNPRPDSEEMADLRERWEMRASRRKGQAPALGLREEVAYRVFPREMTVGTERIFRERYLYISLSLARFRYGKDFHRAPDELRKDIEIEHEEYRYLTGEKFG